MSRFIGASNDELTLGFREAVSDRKCSAFLTMIWKLSTFKIEKKNPTSRNVKYEDSGFNSVSENEQ